jgi:hypothetical protein
MNLTRRRRLRIVPWPEGNELRELAAHIEPRVGEVASDLRQPSTGDFSGL